MSEEPKQWVSPDRSDALTHESDTYYGDKKRAREETAASEKEENVTDDAPTIIEKGKSPEGGEVSEGGEDVSESDESTSKKLRIAATAQESSKTASAWGVLTGSGFGSTASSPWNVASTSSPWGSGQSSWFKSASGNGEHTTASSWASAVASNVSKLVSATKQSGNDSGAEKGTSSWFNTTKIETTEAAALSSEEEDADFVDESEHNSKLLAAEEVANPQEKGDGTGASMKATGEEGESTFIQRRAKLFVLERAKPTVPGAKETKGGAEVEPPKTKSSGETASSATATAPPTVWRESGTGPFRLNVRLDLASKLKLPTPKTTADAPSSQEGVGPSARLIFRQESRIGGIGMRIILNVAVDGSFSAKIHPDMEKAIMFSAPSTAGTLEKVPAEDDANLNIATYLVRFSSKNDAQAVLHAIEKVKTAI